MQTIPLSVDLLNKVLGYLGSRPYHETFQLIDAIQSEAKAQLSAPPEVSLASEPTQ